MSRLAFLYTSSLSAHTFTQTCMSLEACACVCVCVLWCFGVGGNRRNALTGGMFVISCPPCSFLLLHTHTHVQTHLDAHAHTLRGVGTMMGEISSVCVCVSVRSQERFDKDRERPE